MRKFPIHPKCVCRLPENASKPRSYTVFLWYMCVSLKMPVMTAVKRPIYRATLCIAQS